MQTDKIIKTTRKIKKMAIQNQALINVDDQINCQNKKAINDAKFGDPAIVND